MSHRRNSASTRPSGARLARPTTRACALIRRQSWKRGGVLRSRGRSMKAARSSGWNRPERSKSAETTSDTSSANCGSSPKNSGTAMGMAAMVPSRCVPRRPPSDSAARCAAAGAAHSRAASGARAMPPRKARRCTRVPARAPTRDRCKDAIALLLISSLLHHLTGIELPGDGLPVTIFVRRQRERRALLHRPHGRLRGDPEQGIAAPLLHLGFAVQAAVRFQAPFERHHRRVAAAARRRQPPAPAQARSDNTREHTLLAGRQLLVAALRRAEHGAFLERLDLLVQWHRGTRSPLVRDLVEQRRDVLRIEL